MKKLIYLFILAIGFTSCSVESIDSTENLLTADMKFKAASTTEITPPAGDLCFGETLSFSVTANSNKTFQVQQLIEGVWIQVFKTDNAGIQGTRSFDVTLLEGDNYFRSTGATGFDDYPESFVGVDCSTCENLLVADLVCGEVNKLTFTFTAVEAGAIVIQGGLTNGTKILNASSNVLTRNTTHSSVLNSNANVTRWEGDVVACDDVTVTIEYSGGNGIGDWSAKRGEVVLGETEEQTCSAE